MKASDIVTKKDADLTKELGKLREALRESKTGVSAEDKALDRAEARKTVARIQTELTARAKKAATQAAEDSTKAEK